MTTSIFPSKGSRSYQLLLALQQGPGTFYQICERAGFDVEDPSTEERLRRLFDHLISGNACFDGRLYRLTAEARRALEASQPVPYVGQLAGPAYRGISHPTTVFITSRPEGVRA